MTFTVEEMYLIQSMDHSTRRKTMADIKRSIPIIRDEELKELCEKTLKKLRNMSDAEFAAVDFSVYYEDFALIEFDVYEEEEEFE